MGKEREKERQLIRWCRYRVRDIERKKIITDNEWERMREKSGRERAPSGREI